MQFGSVFKLTPKPGQNQAIKDHLTGGRPLTEVKGFVAANIIDCGEEMWGVAVFQDEQTYRDNANDPAQNQEYQKLRALLAADPEWHDGTIVSVTA